MCLCETIRIHHHRQRKMEIIYSALRKHTNQETCRKEHQPEDQKESTQKKRPIEETIEILILQYLAKHNPNDYTFQDYAKNKTDILGSQSKKASNSQQALRLKINQRIFYLKNHKKSLFRLLRKKGLNTFEGRDIPIDDVNTDQEEEDDINSNLCKFSVRFYFTLRLGKGTVT